MAEGKYKMNEDMERLDAIKCQISYFADDEGLADFVKLIGEDACCEVIRYFRNNRTRMKPFRPWNVENIDTDFKDLIKGLTNFNPMKRLTAREALAHKWFSDV